MWVGVFQHLAKCAEEHPEQPGFFVPCLYKMLLHLVIGERYEVAL